MHSISTDELGAVIEWVVFAENEPLMIWGEPGVGKSEVTKYAALQYAQKLFGKDAVVLQYNGPSTLQTARELNERGIRGIVLCDVRLSQYDSVDLRGFPGIDPETHTTVWYPPSTLPFITNPSFDGLDDWLFLIFFDEANAASASVSAVAYQITNDRRCGEHELRANCHICLAGNREGDRGVVNKQPLPLANRLTHVQVVPNVDVAMRVAQMLNWPREWLAFIRFKKELISTFDPSNPVKSFATMRTWEKAMKYYGNPDMPYATKVIAVAGAVGEAAAAQWWAFLDSWEQLSKLMPAIRKDPAKAPVPDEASVAYSIAVACSGEMTLETVTDMHTYLCRMDAEYTILAWQLAVARDKKLFSTKEFVDFSKRFKVVFA